MHNSKLKLAGLLLVAFALKGSYIVQPATGGSNVPSTQTPAFVQAVEAHTAATPTTLGVNMGTLPVVGNVIIFGVGTLGAATDNSNLIATDNQGNSYAQLSLFPLNNGSVPHVKLFCGTVAHASGTFTVTATMPSNDGIGVIAAEYSGTTCNPDQVQFGSTGATSPYACGAGIATQNAKDLLLTLIDATAATGTTTFTAPTGFTIRKSQAVAASGVVMSLADDIVSATGTFNPTYGTGQNHSSTPCIFAGILSR